MGNTITADIGRHGGIPVESESKGAVGLPRGSSLRRRFIDVLNESRPPASFGVSKQEARTDVWASHRSANAFHAAAPVGAGTAIRTLLTRVLDEEKKMNSVLAAAARGKTFSASELLALQSMVFRYTQTVEIVSRAADRVIGAVKQTMGTQV